MKRAASPLTAGLIAKGSAVPSPAVASGHVGAAQADGVVGPSATASPSHKALTVRLDAPRYRALKLAGLEQSLSAQEIFVQALDAWLAATQRQESKSGDGGHAL
jgi:hypothetical protein